MHRTFVRAALAAALSTAFSVQAGQASDDEAAIVVTATRFADADPRVPANISVISREDIRNTPATSLPDILKTRAGVDVRPLYGSLGIDATVDLRGFGDTATSNTLILLDGNRLNPIDMGSINWSAIPLESVQRIEIIRGAGTVLYGDRASGGVINIITDKSGRPRASLAVDVGSQAYGRLDAQASGGGEQLYGNILAHYAADDGWRRNSQQDQRALSGRAGLRLAAGEVFVDYTAFADSAGQAGYLRSAAYQADPRQARTPFDTQRGDGYRLRPGARLNLSDNVALEAEISSEHQDQHASYVSFGSLTDRKKDTLALTPRLRIKHELGGLPSETVLGLDYYDGKVDANYSPGPGQNAKQTSEAIYAQNTTALADWALTLGLRHQRMDQRAHQDAYPAWFSPALDGNAVRSREAYDVGASYRGQGWRAYGKLGSTFRFANTDELFGYDPVNYVPVFAGDLRPQHGAIGEIGGSVVVATVSGRAAAYRMNLTDEIGFDGARNANVNLDPTRRQGVEAELEWRLGAGFDTRLAQTYTDARFREGAYAGRRIPLVARDKTTLTVAWDGGAAGRYSALVNRVGGRYYSGDFDNARGTLAGYTTLDLQAAWTFQPWTITAKLLNATDKHYAPFAGYSPFISDYYYYPADGRRFQLGARYDFR
jgi:iron complex outermembrane recepter protein